MNNRSAYRMIGILAVLATVIPAVAQTQAKKIKALVFLGTDCPISQDYVGTVNKLQQQFSEVDFLIVLPSSNNRDLKLFRKEYQVNVRMKTDKGKNLVEQYDITTTPEVVLLDGESKVHYKGAIDNWYFELGRHRPQPTELYLSSAIEDLLAQRPVRVTSTKPVGCILSRRK